MLYDRSGKGPTDKILFLEYLLKSVIISKCPLSNFHFFIKWLSNKNLLSFKIFWLNELIGGI